MVYNICGLNIEFEPHYSKTKMRSQKYIAENQNVNPDFSLKITEEGIEGYIKIFPQCDKETAEYSLLGMSLFDNILDYDGFFLHSSAISVDGKAYLFTADSGVGKSTHTALWRNHFGSRAVMINDDKPIIRIVDGEIFACGNPFSGKNDISNNIMVPVAGICKINRGKSNSIKRLSVRETILLFMNQTLRINDEDKTQKLLSLFNEVLQKVKVYSLYCDISDAAVTVAYNALNGG